MMKLSKIIVVILIVLISCSSISTFATEYTDKDTIKLVQQALNDLNYNCGNPDGIAGKKTTSAIQEYQSKHGLSVTGIVDDELLESLDLIHSNSSAKEETTFTDRIIDTPYRDYTTNPNSKIKNGNSGIYAYKNEGLYMDNYFIIDFDEGYVYWFSDRDGSTSCDRVQIQSGTLNDVVIITYHDGDDTWSYGLHFAWARQPTHLVMQDNDGFETDYYTTDLKKAWDILIGRRILDY